MEKVALISFGCAKNLVDSEVMLGYLEKAGYTFVTDPGEADIADSLNPPNKKHAALLKKPSLSKEKERKPLLWGVMSKDTKSA